MQQCHQLTSYTSSRCMEERTNREPGIVSLQSVTSTRGRLGWVKGTHQTQDARDGFYFNKFNASSLTCQKEQPVLAWDGQDCVIKIFLECLYHVLLQDFYKHNDLTWCTLGHRKSHAGPDSVETHRMRHSSLMVTQ